MLAARRRPESSTGASRWSKGLLGLAPCLASVNRWRRSCCLARAQSSRCDQQGPGAAASVARRRADAVSACGVKLAPRPRKPGHPLDCQQASLPRAFTCSACSARGLWPPALSKAAGPRRTRRQSTCFAEVRRAVGGWFRGGKAAGRPRSYAEHLERGAPVLVALNAAPGRCCLRSRAPVCWRLGEQVPLNDVAALSGGS